MLHTLQLCRALAAMLVVFFHASGNLASEKYFGSIASPIERAFWFGGDAGVAFFFVLSGFIIHHVHRKDFDRPQRLVFYLRRRATRIYPAYIIIFAAVLLVAKVTPSLGGSIPSDPIVLVKSILLVPQDRQAVGGTGAPIIVVAWSLQYEILFYLFFAGALLNRWLFYATAAILMLNIVVEPVCGPYAFPRNFLASHLILLFGMGVAASAVEKSQFRTKHHGALIIFSAIGFVATAILSTQQRDNHAKPIFDLSYGLVSTTLIFGLARYERGASNQSFAKKFEFLAESSYVLYLVHSPLIVALSKLAVIVLPINIFGVYVAFFVMLVVSIATATLFYRVIERPLLQRLSFSASNRL